MICDRVPIPDKFGSLEGSEFNMAVWVQEKTIFFTPPIKKLCMILMQEKPNEELIV